LFLPQLLGVFLIVTTRSRTQALLGVVAVLAATLLAGCPEDDLGVPCQLEGPGEESLSDGVLLDPLANDCLSRICLGVVEPGQALTGSCTRTCRSDDDCADRSDTCPEGFSCLPATATGPLRCCRLCLCNRHVGVSAAPYCEGDNPACPPP
jgi:hypothetical protein